MGGRFNRGRGVCILEWIFWWISQWGCEDMWVAVVSGLEML